MKFENLGGASEDLRGAATWLHSAMRGKRKTKMFVPRCKWRSAELELFKRTSRRRSTTTMRDRIACIDRLRDEHRRRRNLNNSKLVCGPWLTRLQHDKDPEAEGMLRDIADVVEDRA